jgi:DNA-binding IclR family transcriptional regulator
MSAVPTGTDVRTTRVARVPAESDSGLISEPRRLDTPTRIGRSRPLAAVRAQFTPATIDRQRARRLVTAAEALRRFPFEGLGLPDSNGRAALAREAIADHLQGSEACQLEAFDQALALAAERASLAFRSQEGWVHAVRAGLVALLEFFDEEPKLASYLVVHSAQAGDSVRVRRREVLDQIALLLDDERAPARAYPAPLTAQAVASGVLGVLDERLSQRQPAPLIDLAGPLMSFTVMPFLGVRASRRELAGTPAGSRSPHDAAGLDVLRDPAGRLNPRATAVLSVIGAEPGLNNSQLASRAGDGRAGDRDHGHMSKLLARLERLGLTENTRDPQRRTGPKAWRLTARGEEVEEAIGREAAAEHTSPFDLPPRYVGRLDDRAVLILRAIADQPWLRTGEVAERAGVQDQGTAARLLESPAELGLALSEREPHQKGNPKVWRLTPAGEQLDSAIGREIPAPPRSVTLDLMWQSGGRLGENAKSVLRVIGAEPGLSNNNIAARVAISDENTMSQLLADLTRRGLAHNARTGGRYNVWHLTAAGERLERAIWDETSPALQRSLTLDFLSDRGGRLNHRVVGVLRVIAAEPELSNGELAERVGIEGKGHASTLLTRLARFGVIENVILDPAPFEANAWRLTAAGGDLLSAIGDDPEATATASPHRARQASISRATSRTRSVHPSTQETK